MEVNRGMTPHAGEWKMAWSVPGTVLVKDKYHDHDVIVTLDRMLLAVHTRQDAAGYRH